MICSRFGQSAGATCLSWPEEGRLIVGLMNGRVRSASIASNKCQTLYSADQFTCALSSQ